MEIILLEKVARLGEFGDVVNVRPGYARNYLIPTGKAKYATEENRAEIEARMAELRQRDAELLSTAEARAEAAKELAISVSVETQPDGTLFGSVGVHDIARAIEEAGGDIQRHELRMPDGPLRELGDHQVEAHLHADIDVLVKVTVVSSGVVAPAVEEEESEPEEAPDGAESGAGGGEEKPAE